MDKMCSRLTTVLILTLLITTTCEREKNTKLEDVAGSEEALEFMKTFQGRGVLTDSSQATPPSETLKHFKYPGDLSVDLVLSEPSVTQPVYMTFDHRGRLWVVQYNQYPYPKGLKVMHMDQHIRARFDTIPLPPPEGVKGADKISFFEDTDHDGTFDKCTDAITGLNIATSVAFGRGKIWVMDPPYLIAYPDKNDDGLPDGDPEVHLRGFGIEDTHAVANNLRWGPDGWLYGAQGSTCTATVSSAVSKNIHFDGQVIWRYHPESHRFEVFAEGGGNTFDVEIDDKGRIYSGDNGVTRGRYYKQGAYHLRNLGKHGAFTNPYAFGYLQDMVLHGEPVRFTHAFVRYQEENLPAAYHDKMIAINPMMNLVQVSAFEPNGSTFKITDISRMLTTDDRWFRPVDITTGPDGAVYIADWYDSRLSHVDPRDTWDKSSGRIYRIRNKSVPAGVKPVDIGACSDQQLIELLSHPARWFRQQALAEFGNRHSASVVKPLQALLSGSQGQTALEALWALNLSGGFTDTAAMIGISHTDPFVRMWTVRLCGDNPTMAAAVFDELVRLAGSEKNPEVRSQVAATARRLPGKDAIRLISALLKHDDAGDPDIPLQTWWALEANALSEREAILKLFEDKAIWSSQTVSSTILPRLTQRWIMQGETEDYDACAKLLAYAPSPQHAKPVIAGIQEGLRGEAVTNLPVSLLNALKPFRNMFGNETTIIALRQRQKKEIEYTLSVVKDQQASLGERLSYIRTYGEVDIPEAVNVLLQLIESSRSSSAIRKAALKALARYDDPQIGARVVKAYPDLLRAEPDVRIAALSLLASRPEWSMQLLTAITKESEPDKNFIGHTIEKDDVPLDVVRQMLLHEDALLTAAVMKVWPEAKPATTKQINQRIAEVSKILSARSGDPSSGYALFTGRCGGCHRLFGEGANIGPDLTGYDRKNTNEMLSHIIDPSAYIREGYTVYHIKTTDKRSFVGLLKARHGTTITLQLFQGDTITLSMDQVAEMNEQPGSLMPEGLLEGLTDTQLQDLIAYLSKQG